jgi:hypothetical protein
MYAMTGRGCNDDLSCHGEPRTAPPSLRAAQIPSVIARRSAPWQSMSLCDRRWIASFLSMNLLF